MVKEVLPQALLLKHVHDLLNWADETSPNIQQVRNLIAEAGITPGIHVGSPPGSFDKKKTCEWLLGQIASIIDKEGWFAMNGILNLTEATLDGKDPSHN